MRTRIQGLLLLIVSTLFLSGFASAETVTVVGQDNILVDRQNIQDAVDSAPGKNLKVKLQGTFQFDGTPVAIARSNLSIEGNGAILNGITDVDGLPDISNPNRAFNIRNDAAAIEKITIEELAFNGFIRAINLVGLAPVDKVVIRDNQMDNVIYGVLAQGSFTDFKIDGNRITNALSDAVIVDGLELPLSKVKITDNLMSSPTSSVFQPVPVPLEIYGPVDDIEVTGNTFVGGLAPVGLFYGATKSKFKKNCVRDGDSFVPGVGGLFIGLFLPDFNFVVPASGWEVKNNSYVNNLTNGEPLDISLAENADNVSVDESLGAVILDNGVSNSVIQQGDDKGYCDDDSDSDSDN